MSQRVDLLPSSAYFRQIETVTEGKQGFTHTALLQIKGRASRYYIKSYLNAAKPLFNEISGFLLASAAGLPQATNAALIAIPGSILEKAHPNHGFNQQEHWVCWCTSAIAAPTDTQYPSATTHFNCDFAAIAADIRLWTKLPTLLAFDEWVANIDRNTGNLIRLAANDYAIIDHGAILTGPNWASDVLAPIASYTNKLWDLLRRNRGVPLPISSQAIHASTSFAAAYNERAPEISTFGSELLNAQEITGCDTFLRARSTTVNQYLKQRLGVLV